VPARPIPMTGKRDLSKLLSTTPEMICSKLEELIQSQHALGRVPTLTDLSQITQMIARLPDSQNMQQFGNLTPHLLTDLQKFKANSQSYNNSGHHDIDREKEQYILDYHAHRNAKVEELNKRKGQLELECRNAEESLTRRVKELHADPLVQSALT
jgi:hypothetical protein